MVLLPEDCGELERIVATLQPGQWVRFAHTFANVRDPLYGVARFAGVTSHGTVVMDYTRKHIGAVRRSVKNRLNQNITTPCSKSSKPK